METVDIWYITDDDRGKDIARSMKSLGLSVHAISPKQLQQAEILTSAVNLCIFDLYGMQFPELMNMIRDDLRIQNILKFVLLPGEEVEDAIHLSNNMLHVEFISRPIRKREFILLLEKSVIVEKYRDMMKYISREAEDRIEAYESLVHIHKKDIFADEQEKLAFERIITFEKNLLEEQHNLNQAIKDFTYLRQRELFEMKNLIHANEMVGHLRRKELVDAHDMIRAQQAVLDFSSQELDTAKKILEASERTGELSREEALALHKELRNKEDIIGQLTHENESLKREIANLKGK